MTELEEIMTDQQAYSVLTAMADDADDFEQRLALEVALDALGERMGQLCVDETPEWTHDEHGNDVWTSSTPAIVPTGCPE